MQDRYIGRFEVMRMLGISRPGMLHSMEQNKLPKPVKLTRRIFKWDRAKIVMVMRGHTMEEVEAASETELVEILYGKGS